MPPDRRYYELNDEDEQATPVVPEKPARRRTKSARDWTCPNCGAEFKDSHALVCFECGFDMKSLKIVKTVTGKPVDGEGDEAADGDVLEQVRPRKLSKRRKHDPWLPLGIGAGATAILVLGYWLGAPGLFHLAKGESLDFGARMTGLAQFVALAGLLAGCGMLSLLFLAYLLETRIGDGGLATLRVGAIAVAMRLVAFIDFTGRASEWLVEAILQAAIFIALTILLFRFALRHLLTFAMVALMTLVTTWLLAELIVWAT